VTVRNARRSQGIRVTREAACAGRSWGGRPARRRMEFEASIRLPQPGHRSAPHVRPAGCRQSVRASRRDGTPPGRGRQEGNVVPHTGQAPACATGSCLTHHWRVGIRAFLVRDRKRPKAIAQKEIDLSRLLTKRETLARVGQAYISAGLAIQNIA